MIDINLWQNNYIVILSQYREVPSIRGREVVTYFLIYIGCIRKC